MGKPNGKRTAQIHLRREQCAASDELSLLSTMDSSSLAAATSSLSVFPPSLLQARSLTLHRRHKFLVFASKQDADSGERKKKDATGEKPGQTLPKQGKPVGSVDGLNLVRPVPKKGVKFESSVKPNEPVVRKPNLPLRTPVVDKKKGPAPDVVLRKPGPSKAQGVGGKLPGLSLKPNLSLNNSDAQSAGKSNDMTLLKKPGRTEVNGYSYEKQEPSSSGQRQSRIDKVLKMVRERAAAKQSDIKVSDKVEGLENNDVGTSEPSEMDDETKAEFNRLVKVLGDLLKRRKERGSNIGRKQVEHSAVESAEEEPAPTEQSANGSARADTDFAYPAESNGSGVDVELQSSNMGSPSKDLENTYWTRAKELLESRKMEEVELIRASKRGFVVSFGPLLGLLPYSNLTGKWKFVTFETWLRNNGLDPSAYMESLGSVQSNGVANSISSPEVAQKIEGGFSPDMQLEDLLKVYDQGKTKFFSSFVGQTPKVCLESADREAGKLIFTLKSNEDDVLVEKKKNLMAKLQIGDIVKCRVNKIADFGVFVEVEGVPALIHQTEVSWDATLDPSASFQIGQILDAKVHELNFELERICLSLRDLTPDPLSGILESVIGDDSSFDGILQPAEADTEWAEVESLIKELQQIKGIQSASKGQFFLSPGLAPTFQVYMTSMSDDQYKLLARAGNKVQEVIVRASLDKEAMRSAISTCTERVG